MGRKTQSRADKVRNMLSQGVPPKEIAAKLGMKVQTVYTIRYIANKKQGVGALPKPELAKDGIASVPRKRGRPSKKPIVVPSQTEKREAPTTVVRDPNMQPKVFPSWWMGLMAAVVAAVVIAVATRG